MSTVQGSFAGVNTVRNISLIQRSLSKAMHRVPPVRNENDVAAETPEAPNEVVISQQMRSQIGPLTDSIRMLEFKLGRNEAAGGAISELVQKAKEMREAAAEAVSETVIDLEKSKAFQSAFNELAAQFNEKLEQASFAGRKLLDGSSDAAVKIRPMPQLDVSSNETAKATVKEIDCGLRALDEARIESEVKTRKEYEATTRQFEVVSQHLSTAESPVNDAESAVARADYLKAIVTDNASLAASAQGKMTSDTVFKLLHA